MSDLEAGRRQITSFASSVSQAVTARTVDLLADIENTLESLDLTTDLLDAHESYAAKAIQRFAAAGCPLDPKGELGAVLEKAGSAVHELYRDLIDRRDSAREDARLKEEDGLEAAFTRAIESAADLFNSLEDLRFVIAENDVTCQEYTPDGSRTFSDPESLRAYLATL